MTFREILTLSESGDSATPVKWRLENGNKIGEFQVKSKITKKFEIFTIVISKKEKYKSFIINNINIVEFKFYDPDGNIELKKNMEFVLGVGPTIKREFEKLMDTKPEAVLFSSDKHEISRSKHYEKFTHKIADDYGYIPFFKTAITSGEDEFILVRPDKVEDFKKNFKTSSI